MHATVHSFVAAHFLSAGLTVAREIGRDATIDMPMMNHEWHASDADSCVPCSPQRGREPRQEASAGMCRRERAQAATGSSYTKRLFNLIQFRFRLFRFRFRFRSSELYVGVLIVLPSHMSDTCSLLSIASHYPSLSPVPYSDPCSPCMSRPEATLDPVCRFSFV